MQAKSLLRILITLFSPCKTIFENVKAFLFDDKILTGLCSCSANAPLSPSRSSQNREMDERRTKGAESASSDLPKRSLDGV